MYNVSDSEYTVKPHYLEPLGNKEMTLTYQEFRVKWLDCIEKYFKGFEI